MNLNLKKGNILRPQAISSKIYSGTNQRDSGRIMRINVNK